MKAPRQRAARRQEEMAAVRKIEQPWVPKIERQTNLHLSTLRRYAEAVGDTLGSRVELPGKGVKQLTGFGDLLA